MTNTQEAPFPQALKDLCRNLRYKEGWNFRISHEDRGQGSVGLTLGIVVDTPNSYEKPDGDPRKKIKVLHLFPIPPASYNERTWRRWLLDRIIDVETHEACEFFRFHRTEAGGFVRGDCVGEIIIERPYAPHHGPGEDPYTIFERGSDEEARTTFRGDVQ